VNDDHLFEVGAEFLGCEIAAIRAVFEVESGGRFFNRDGSLPSRFEPHHMPSSMWDDLGFAPGDVRPWRASLAMSETDRGAMFARAIEMDREAAYNATSWGGPQIMGFNHEDCGWPSAIDMVEDMGKSPEDQVEAFARFVRGRNLGPALRAHDWVEYARGYNGNGQPEVYAAKIASAYRRASGHRSSVVLRLGSHGADVEKAQEALRRVALLSPAEVDGSFGPRTEAAVRAFQSMADIPRDGVIGAVTWAALEHHARAQIDPAPAPDRTDNFLVDLARSIPGMLGGAGGGAVLMQFWNSLIGPERWVILAIATLGACGGLFLYFVPRFRAATRGRRL